MFGALQQGIVGMRGEKNNRNAHLPETCSDFNAIDIARYDDVDQCQVGALRLRQHDGMSTSAGHTAYRITEMFQL